MSPKAKEDPPPPRSHFFVKQLQGEEALSLETAQVLCRLSQRFLLFRPWELLKESQLVFVSHPTWEEPHACSVLGALGEVFALNVYLGSGGYHFFHKLQSARNMSVGAFFAEQSSISVEFVRSRELTKPDRDLLKEAGAALFVSGPGPKFRAIRPGYHPWYLTEGEGRILLECLGAMNEVCELVSTSSGFWNSSLAPGFWKKNGVYPFVWREAAEGQEAKYIVRPMQAPRKTLRTPAPPAPDKARIDRILGSRPRQGGVMQADHFYGAGMIGEPQQRKACVRMALAIDAESGFAFPPEVAMPDASTGEMLVNVVLKAIESGKVLPQQLHVRERTFKHLLEPLAAALGFDVVVRKSLPALDSMRNDLLKSMGDPGAVPLRSP